MANTRTTSSNGKAPKAVLSARKPGLKKSKSKVSYSPHKPGALQMHDAPQVLELPEAPDTALEPTEYETELADKLLAEVAETGSDVKQLCDTYGLKRDELGRLTGFSLRALAEWASGKFPSQPAKRRLQEVRRLLDALAGIVQPERIPQWLHQPNPAFGRLTPLQIIELGEIDRLWAMVYDLGSGQPD
jgi:DNA-binding transcriptional regulator YiaG